MHTVFENGNFDEVWFGSVNLLQNADVGMGDLRITSSRPPRSRVTM